jgi:NADPH:quinone reductase-like Zn-dependent oxidoreductase
MSRTIKFSRPGAPEVLEFIETHVPNPAPTEVRINVKAIGLNRAESMWRHDEYIEPVHFPAGLGYEAAGIVNAGGSEVTDFVVGDAVNVLPTFSMNEYTTYGEVINVPAEAVVSHPYSLSFDQAASVWMMYLTAYGALIQDAKVSKGDFVIIPAASSSVGLTSRALPASVRVGTKTRRAGRHFAHVRSLATDRPSGSPTARMTVRRNRTRRCSATRDQDATCTESPARHPARAAATS